MKKTLEEVQGMEIAEFREKAAKMGLPQDIVGSLIADYVCDSKKEDAVSLAEVLEIAKKPTPMALLTPRLMYRMSIVVNN